MNQSQIKIIRLTFSNASEDYVNWLNDPANKSIS